MVEDVIDEADGEEDILILVKDGLRGVHAADALARVVPAAGRAVISKVQKLEDGADDR